MDDERLQKLAATLTYIVERSPRRIGRTMLQKLAYLADVEAVRRRGRPITEAEYIAYDHGPWQRELYDALACAPIRERRYFWRLDRPSYEYELAPNARPDYSALEPEEREILDEIIQEFGTQPLTRVLRYVYSNPPYAGTEFGEAIDLLAVAGAAADD